MTSALRCQLILCAGLAAGRALAGWGDATLGQPLVRAYTASAIGRPAEAWGGAIHPRTGQLLVATSLGPVSFDGAAWRLHDAGHGNETRCLTFGPDGRLWAGAVDHVGWYRLQETTGALSFHSLTELIPPEHRAFGTVWGCFADRDYATFVATSKLLVWDGVSMRVWHFPTADRLYPVECEGALWFQHLETGLYRLAPEGPVLEVPASHLPRAGLVSLRRTPEGLEAMSSAGLLILGEKPRQRGTPELLRWLADRRLTAAAHLPDGSWAIASPQGLALASSDGRLLRTLDARSGLPANSVANLLLDREGQLWGFSRHGIFTFAAIPAATLHHPVPARPGTPILAVTHDGQGALWAATEEGVFGFRPAVPGPPVWHLEFKPNETPSSLHWTGRELLHGLYRGIQVTSPAGTRTLATLVTPASPAIVASHHDANLLHVAGGNFYSQLLRDASGEWRHLPVADLGFAIKSLAETGDGGVLFGGKENRLVRYDLAGRRRQLLRLDLESTAPTSDALVVGGGRFTFAFASAKLFAWLNGALAPQPVFPPLSVQAAALSADHSSLYVVFNRGPGSLQTHGLGVVSVQPDGTAAAWQELAATGLDAIGTPTRLEVLTEGPGDTLLLAGSEGLLRIRPSEVVPWSPPSPPTLRVVTGPESCSPDALPFANKRIAVSLGSPDLSQRSSLLFQIRLGEADEGTWESPSPVAHHDFSHLREGTYTFSARAVNAAGQAGAPVHFAFRVLPPWWRSPWAYAAYALLAGTALLGAMHLRERRIRARNLELEKLVLARTDELLRANAAKDAFLASMSHEIRNPMNGVVGLSAAIDTTPLDSEARHRFGLLRHCAAHLSALLDDILDFSRLQSGSIELNEQPFSPAEMVESVTAITAADSAAAGLPVHTALAPNVPARLVGDARRIRQVLLNFVTNALKYAGRGSIEVTGWTTPLDGDRVQLTFVVSDDGPGVAPEEQERIFEKFERGHTARESRIPGTGMGLAVCRQLAERMGGRVWLESEPGRGSAFYFAAPLAVAPSAHQADGRPPALPSAHLRALVVDDEEYNRVALGAMLGKLGFAVTEAADPSTALAQARSTAFDLVCLDYDLPEIQGPELARQIRALRPASPDAPLLLAATAYTTVEIRQQCLAAGMDGFIGKPVTPERLREALRAAYALRVPAAPAPLAPAGADSGPDDPYDNLRLVAARNGRTLAEESAAFVQQCTREFDALDAALAQRDAAAAARIAHQIAGLLGFVRARDAAAQALEVEQSCRSQAWDEAQARRRQLAATWAWHHSLLTIPPGAPAASGRA